MACAAEVTALPPAGQKLFTIGLCVAGLSALSYWGPLAAAYWGPGTASAYLTAPGSGTGAVLVGALDPPADVAAYSPAGAHELTISWATTTGPSEQLPEGFYVTKTDGVTTQAACSTSLAHLVPAGPGHEYACKDTDVASGTYTYTVTAVLGSWTASASSGPVTATSSSTTSTTTSSTTTTSTTSPASTLGPATSTTAGPTSGGASSTTTAPTAETSTSTSGPPVPTTSTTPGAGSAARQPVG